MLVGCAFSGCNDTTPAPTNSGNNQDSTDNKPKTLRDDLPGVWDIESISATGNKYEAGFKVGAFTWEGKDNSSTVEFTSSSSTWNWNYTRVETVKKSSGDEITEKIFDDSDVVGYSVTSGDLLVDGSLLMNTVWKQGEMTLSYSETLSIGQGAEEEVWSYTITYELKKR